MNGAIFDEIIVKDNFAVAQVCGGNKVAVF